MPVYWGGDQPNYYQYDQPIGPGLPGSPGPVYDYNPTGYESFDDQVTSGDKVRNPFYVDQVFSRPPMEDEWDFWLGVSHFRIPPTSVIVTEVNSNIAANYVLRSKTSSKASPGKKQKRVSIRLIFTGLDHNFDSLWEGPDSLRGLVTQFRTVPFLPVANKYLNDVHGIDGLAMQGMSVSTVPGQPYTIAVNLECYKFDFRAYVPYWGSMYDIIDYQLFTDYYNRAKRMLDQYVSPPPRADDPTIWYDEFGDPIRDGFANWTSNGLSNIDDAYEDALEEKFGPVIDDSTRRLEIYYSDRDYSTMMWLNKLGAEQTTDQSGAVDLIQGDWWDLSKKIIEGGFFRWFFTDGAQDPMDVGQDSIEDVLSSTGLSSENELWKAFEAFHGLISLTEYMIIKSSKSDQKRYNDAVDRYTEEILQKSPFMGPDTARRMAVYTLLRSPDIFDALLSDERIVQALRDEAVRWVHEWELPMRRVGLLNEDMYNTVIVESITASTSNAIVTLPLEGKPEPLYQHLGGMGTQIQVNFKVIGERAIKHLREVFDRISVSSLANKEAGVTGFLGLRNEFINALGVKYALLDTFTVATIDGFPHVYDVSMTLSDFDILQQKREMPSTVERVKMEQESAAGNPVMRGHQVLAKTNAYPDLPLPRMRERKYRLIPDSTDNVWGEKITIKRPVDDPTDDDYWSFGQYLDPDYYFRDVMFPKEITKQSDDTGTDGSLHWTKKYGDYIVNPLGDAYKVNLTVKPSDNPGEYSPRVSMSLGETDSAEAKRKIMDISTDKNNTGSVQNAELTSKVIDEIEDRYGSDFFISTYERFLDPAAGRFDIQEIDAWVNLKRGDENSSENLTEEQMGHRNILWEKADMARRVDDMHLEQEYQDGKGRMIRAFPTYMVYLIDEGGKILTFKMFDTFYGLQSVIGMDVMLDKEAPMDTAVIQFSNLYKKLSTPQWFQSYNLPKFIRETWQVAWTTQQRVFGYVSDIENMKIDPGMRIQIRMGYSANPEALFTIFNGTITEVTDGSTMTVVAQGDGSELAKITGTNFKPNAATDSFLGIPSVEPQDLIIRYLSATNSVFQSWQRRGSAGINPGQEGYGISHFGSLLWDYSKFGGQEAFQAYVNDMRMKVMGRLDKATQNIADATGEQYKYDAEGQVSLTAKGKWFGAISSMLGLTSSSASDFLSFGVENWFDLAEDWEVFKRNIYPGNGTGYRTFPDNNQAMTKTTLSSLGSALWQVVRPSYIDRIVTDTDPEGSAIDERTVRFNTGGKTNWEIFKMCEAMLPNYVLAVRPFEHRSTLFYGKQAWAYTSGVIPLFDGVSLKDWEMSFAKYNEFKKEAIRTERAGGNAEEDLRLGYGGHESTVYPAQYWDTWVVEWLVDRKGKKWMFEVLGSTIPEHMGTVDRMRAADTDIELLDDLYDDFLAWISDDWFLLDTLVTTFGYYGNLYINNEEKLKAPFIEREGQSPCTPRKRVNDWTTERKHPRNFKEIWIASEYKRVVPGMGDVWVDRFNGTTPHALIKAYWECFMQLQKAEREYPEKGDTYHTLRYWAYYKAGQEAIRCCAHLVRSWQANRGTTSINLGESENLYDVPFQILFFGDEEERLDHYIESLRDFPSGEGTHNENVFYCGFFIDTRYFKDMVDKWMTSNAQTEGPVSPENQIIYGYGQYLTENDENEVGGLDIRPSGYRRSPQEIEGFTSAIAYLATFMAGSLNNILDASYYNSEFCKMTYDSLQDCIYYGIAEGTKYDSYAGSDRVKRLIEAGKTKEAIIRELYSALPEDVKFTRKLQVMADNPFSREFGEPVLEVREPFSRFHAVDDVFDIVSNGVFADGTNVANQIRAIAHTTSRNNAKKDVVVKADASIPANKTIERIVDTGYNYEWGNWYDTSNHKNMALHALKRSLQQMYGGELLLIGRPELRPFDFLWMWDTPNKMNGWCEIERVTHHIGIDTGFTTSVKVAPIISVDDSYLWGMFTFNHAKNQDQIARYVVAQNLAYGFSSVDQVQSVYENITADKIVQASLGVLDGNTESWRYQYMSNYLPLLSTVIAPPAYDRSVMGLLEEADDILEKWKRLFPDRAVEVTYEKMRSAWIDDSPSGIPPTPDYYALWDYITMVENIPVSNELKDKYINEMCPELFSFLGQARTVRDEHAMQDPESVDPYQYSMADASGGFINMMLSWMNEGASAQLTGAGAAVAGTGAFATLAAGAGVITGSSAAAGAGVLGTVAAVGSSIVGWPIAVLLGGLAIAGAGIGIQNLVNYIAEQEPISVMLLNKDGQPLHAGLIGADGIVIGKPSSFPVISDLLKSEFPADQPETVWNRLGISLGKASMLTQAETMAKAEAMARAISVAQRPELGYVAGLDTGKVTKEVTVVTVIDGDTFDISSPIDANGTSCTRVRMKYVDSPELSDREGDYGYVRSHREQFSGDATAWLTKRLKGKKVKLIWNKVVPVDNYGRLLAVVVDKTSAGANYGNDEYLKGNHFDWLRDSIQGEIITDSKLMRWYKPYITIAGATDPNDYPAIGDKTGTSGNLPTYFREEI